MKKYLVLGALFILPIVAYLFFASGVNNFARLPVLTKDVHDTRNFTSLSGEAVTLNGKITILGFLGDDPGQRKGNAFNLNQKIYKRFYEFNDFQMAVVLPRGTEEQAGALKKELGTLSDPRNWKFIFGSEQQIKELFDSFQTDLALDAGLGTPYVFIIDKDRSLRGRTDTGDGESGYGFNAGSVAALNNKMLDDIKVILAEYRLALKKNNAYRKN